MVLAALLFASMGVCVKIASQWFSSAELVFYRGLISIVFLWLLATVRGIRLGVAHRALRHGGSDAGRQPWRRSEVRHG